MKKIYSFLFVLSFAVLCGCAAVPLSQVTLEKIARLQWSPISEREYDAGKASQYCSELNSKQYGGHGGWRLPTIDELRSIVKNCPGTELGGECRVSEANSNLSYIRDYKRKYCHACEGNNPQEHSKLYFPSEYVTTIISKSPVSDDRGFLWGVGFDEYGSLLAIQKGYYTSVVCVREN